MRTDTPIGIVLTDSDDDDGTYKRIGFFCMGRRDLSDEDELDGLWSPGARGWDWDGGLEMGTVAVV
jgi:hypothetical protein